MAHHFISDTFAAAPIERTRDDLGNELTYKDSDGAGLWVALALAHDPEYVLYYNAGIGIYWAGCRRFSRTDALAHWAAPARTDARAVLFHAAITQHTPTPLTSSTT